MTLLDPDRFPVAWDVASFGGKPTPGLTHITQAGRVLKWDKKPGFGTSGATTKLTGIDPGSFALTIRFVDGVGGETAIQQRERYEADILPQLIAAETGKTAIPFYHVAVSEPPMNVTAIVPERIGVYEQDADGAWSVTHQLVQYGKPKPAAGAPKASKKKDGDKPAQDENEKLIEKLTKELKELADG